MRSARIRKNKVVFGCFSHILAKYKPIKAYCTYDTNHGRTARALNDTSHSAKEQNCYAADGL